MIGKKKYTQAELDAAVAAAKRAAELDAKISTQAAVDANVLRDGINLVRRILGQAPAGLLYTAAFYTDGQITHHAISADDLKRIFAGYDSLGYRP